ncbi:MAG: CDGSH iron-sulfur domain-containing protein [Phycisphaerales bacterium]
MARRITLSGTGPIRIDPQDKPVFVCGCGLTGNFPFCDGTHKTCKDEEDGKVYEYDEQGHRREIEG